VLATGVVGAARGWSDRGVAVIVGAGLVCLLLALVAHRIAGVTVEHGKDGTKVGSRSTPRW
jgi:hypothetical protein